MSKSFEARYEGHCAAGCLDPIEAGDTVTYVDDKLVHADCARDHTMSRRPVTICQSCWLAQPCACEDDR